MEDELKILLPGETYILSNGGRVEIQPVPFGRLRIFYEIFYALMQKLDFTGLKFENLEEWKSAFELFKSEIDDLLSLVLDNTTQPPFKITPLYEPSHRPASPPPLKIRGEKGSYDDLQGWIDIFDFSDRMAIFIIIIEQNFRAGLKPAPTKEISEYISYVDIIATLIKAGHSWTEIKGYTLDQIGAFFDSIKRLENFETRKDTVSMFIASQGSKKNIEEYLDKLMPIKKAGIDEFLKDHRPPPSPLRGEEEGE